MKKHSNTFLILALSIWANLSIAQDLTLARTPALSPNENEIAFSYQGDIWTYDLQKLRANRITIHEAYESNPVFSPNGNKIAFNGNRFGNNDLFTIPREGGFPNRLSYHSAGDNLSDWTKDGDLLFGTSRTYRQIERGQEIYKVSSKGGTPVRILDAIGKMATKSPDGKYIAFVKGACRIEREAYNGPADMEIWVYKVATKEYIRITNNEGNDYLPKWKSNRELFYLGSVKGKYNIQSVKLEGESFSEARSVTNFVDDGVRYYDVQGNSIVMERAGKLFLQKTDEALQEIDLDIKSDYRFDPKEKKSYSNNLSSYSISPNAKNVALVIRGEVFVKPLDKEKSRANNLSNHAYRDYDLTWLNDSSLLFISDRDGQYDIYMATSADPKKSDLSASLKHKLKRITNSPENEGDLYVSPDGKKILFKRSTASTELIVANISANGKISGEKTLLKGWDAPSGIKWSPDSRYIAYSQSDLTFNDEVYIMDVASGKAHNISMHPKGDFGPFWSEDGSKLGFLSERNNGDSDVWFVWLQKEEWQKTEEDREDGYYFQGDEKEDKPKKSKKDKKDKKKDKKVKPIKIDFEEIHNRLSQVTSLPGNERQVLISKDGETFYFTASSNVSRGSDLYSIKFDGSEIKQLSKGGKSPRGLQLDPKGTDLYGLRRGVLNKIGAKKGDFTSYPHSAKMIINHSQEREEVFEEGWMAIKNGFYDPNFHGEDWKALHDKYKPQAMAASTDQDFRYIFNLMLGQLNASHMGMYGSNPEQTVRERTGKLGIEVRPGKKGLMVSHVVKNSPADRSQSKINEGDIILEVDGQEITETTNFYELFQDESNNEVLMKLKAKSGKNREIAIRPSRSLGNLLYEEWVRERKRLVEEYSDGRLGYIHIQGMNFPSFERFERELTASGLGKEGIVIDVRFNGGGWTTDYLMAVLNVQQHAYTVPRGAAENLEKENGKFKEFYPYSERLPLASWTKPSIAMCNESSYSNAEIFSHAYKSLGLGSLVGMPTFGAVISTGGKGLLDGSFIRMPFRGWYVKSSGMNMENGPAVPDVVLENAPDERAKGTDTQLKKAVEILLQQIEN